MIVLNNTDDKKKKKKKKGLKASNSGSVEHMLLLEMEDMHCIYDSNFEKYCLVAEHPSYFALRAQPKPTH